MDDIWRIARFIAGRVFEHFQQSLTQSVISIREDKPMVKLAVPRKVVGTIIGRNGGHIQKLRHGTSAHIHISPLFVADDSACGERVISVISRDLLSLRTAIYTLAGLINQHPDRGSCRRVIYSACEPGSQEIRITSESLDKNEPTTIDNCFLVFKPSSAGSVSPALGDSDSRMQCSKGPMRRTMSTLTAGLVVGLCVGVGAVLGGVGYSPRGLFI